MSLREASRFWLQLMSFGGLFLAPSIVVLTTLVSIWFTFLPSFGFILASDPLVEANRNNLRLGTPLSAITAAVMGAIASLVVFFQDLTCGPLAVPVHGPLL